MKPFGSCIQPNHFDELLELPGQIGSSDDSGYSGAAVDIEKEAAYVDQEILEVGNFRDSIQRYSGNFSQDYWLSLNDPGFRMQISSLLTPEDRVDFAWKYFIGLRILPDVLKKYQKDDKTSQLMRDRGNDLYKQKRLQVALHYYNLALMFAETDSEAAGMAYANRSAVLIQLGRFEDALEDIELALKNKYPVSRFQKLEQRRVKCQESILKNKQEYEATEPKLRKEIETEIQKMRSFLVEKLRVKKPNPLIPAAAGFVEIKFDEVQGRHLVVNQDVAPGTVVIAEDPYMFTLYCESKWHTQHCHHCLKRVRGGIPCPNCVFAIYCNETCRKESRRIHKYECSCLPSVHAISLPDQALKAIRIIIKVGSEELFRLFETRDPVYFHPKQPFGTQPNCKYESQSYLSTFHLMTHSDKLVFDKWIGNALNAVLAAEILKANTAFFCNVPSNLKDEFKRFISTLMLRHIEAACINTVGVSEPEGLDGVTLADAYRGKLPPERSSDLQSPNFGKVAGALYPVISLMSHSCDPNVRYLNRPTNGTMVAVASRSLKKGENLLISYVSNFHDEPISSRQAQLQENYYFQCRCVACEKNWPTSAELVRNEMPTFCCRACSRTFFEYDKGSREFRKCVLAPPQLKCGICGKLYKKTQLWFPYEANMLSAAAIPRFLERGRPRKAFYECVKLVEYFQQHVCPPFLELFILQDRLLVSLWLMMYFAQ